jgi:stage V sporulation protein SpoVS
MIEHIAYIVSDPDAEGFTRRLSPTGAEPATHAGAYALAISEADHDELIAAGAVAIDCATFEGDPMERFTQAVHGQGLLVIPELDEAP